MSFKFHSPYKNEIFYSVFTAVSHGPHPKRVYSSIFNCTKAVFVFQAFPCVKCVHATFITATELSAEKLIQTPSPLVRKRTIPTERPPLVDEIQ
jgi:hypothetical protein